jgi:hypothetical protein
MNVAGPAFTHIMYADDIMVFAKANCREVKILDECLEKYCIWSGQLINRSKSGLIFSKLVCCARRRELKSMLAMKKIQPNAKYLGSPLFSSSSRIKDFKFLQDKLESRLLGWRSKALSWAGRATLIKLVALALPSYTFSSSNVPVAVCEKMDALSVAFGGTQVVILVASWPGKLGQTYVPRELVGVWVSGEPSTLMMRYSLSLLGWLPLAEIAHV